jgi:uncharacterized protein YaaQ
MKLIFAVIKDDDMENVVQALTKDNFRVTRVASTGGIFRKGSTTLLIGVDDDQVDAAIQILRSKTTVEANEQKRGTVFVVPVSRFEQL